ncbi:MAG: amidase, partial [Rhodothermia bacterium]
MASIGGITRNPYDLDRVPAGSSGGTASAVAANLGTIGLGTDTGNSIRGPSSHASLVGLRSTMGLTSRDGIVPLFLRNDVGGPMCRTVRDVARVMDVIAGFDPADPITAKSRGHIPATYLDSLKADGLRGTRLGVLRTLCDQESADAEIRHLFRTAVSDLRNAGAEVVDVAIPSIRVIQKDLWRDTFRHDIEQYLNSLGKAAPVKTLRAIIESGRFHESIAGHLSRSLQARIPRDLKAPYSADPANDPARRELRTLMLAVMNENQVDAVIFPTWNNPPRRIGDLKSPHGNNSPFIAPHTGQPAITVPMGFTRSGLPAGLQLLGRPFSEPTLLRLAFAYEQATNHR